MSEETGDEGKMVQNTDFLEEIQSGDRRRQLVAMRDLMAQELDGNRCKSCRMLQIRSGEIAALVLRLQKVIEEIATLPKETPDGKPERTSLELIRGRRDEHGDHGPRGTKSDARRQGGRRTGN